MRQFINNYLEALSPLIPLLLLLITYSRQKLKVTNALSLHFTLIFILKTIVVWTGHYNIPNIRYYNAICIVSFCTIAYIFFQVFNLTVYKKALVVSSVLYIFVFFILLIFWDDNMSFNSTGFSLASLLIIVYSFLYFKEKIALADVQQAFFDKTFWIVTGLFIYYFGCFFIFLTFRFLTLNGILTDLIEERKSLGTLWGIQNIIYFLSCISVSIGILWRKSQIRYTS